MVKYGFLIKRTSLHIIILSEEGTSTEVPSLCIFNNSFYAPSKITAFNEHQLDDRKRITFLRSIQ